MKIARTLRTLALGSLIALGMAGCTLDVGEGSDNITDCVCHTTLLTRPTTRPGRLAKLSG